MPHLQGEMEFTAEYLFARKDFQLLISKSVEDMPTS
jgi:hypothetical protein